LVGTIEWLQHAAVFHHILILQFAFVWLDGPYYKYLMQLTRAFAWVVKLATSDVWHAYFVFATGFLDGVQWCMNL